MDFKVITVKNDKNKMQYEALFQEAYQTLAAMDPSPLRVTHEDGMFHSLEEYFGHIEDLQDLKYGKFLMLALDEEAFTINANTRSITAPKITVVQNDQMAEIVIFTIDRYFDYMDLVSDDMNIYVQWTLPNKTTGATRIKMIDVDTIPGKVRLGWPLEDVVTAEAGDVQFSVRFWKKGEVEDADGNPVERIVYSLNTIPAKITVTKALQADVNATNIYESDSLFSRVIKNSTVMSDPNPVFPDFNSTGAKNLTASTELVDGSELRLSAQANVTDGGELTYEWFYIPAGSDIAVSGEDLKNLEFTEGYDYRETALKDGANLELTTRYFVWDESKNKYVRYTSTTGKKPEGVTLYEEYATLVSNEDNEKVTGQYYVKATNTLGDANNRNHRSKSVESLRCTLNSPEAVEILTDLPDLFIIENGKNTLSIITNTQSDIKANMSYSWDYSGVSADDLTDLSGATEKSLTVSEAGWYRAEATVLLNKETKNAFSKVCKVVNLPVAPVLTYNTDVMSEYVMSEDVPVIQGNAATFTIGVKMTNTIENGPLTSEGITYIWSMEDGKNIADYVQDSGMLATNTIVLKNTPDADADVLNITCKAINTLEGRTAESNVLKFNVVV